MIFGMLAAGTTSWAMSIDEPLMLLIALYVRDASGLHSHLESEIQALEPAVLPDIGSSVPQGVASRQWEHWWHEILEGGGLWPEDVDPHDAVAQHLQGSNWVGSMRTGCVLSTPDSLYP